MDTTTLLILIIVSLDPCSVAVGMAVVGGIDPDVTARKQIGFDPETLRAARL